MSMPKNITSGFDFDEAIEMTELSRRVYKIFEYEKGRDIQQLYNSMYNDEWVFVHGITDYATDGRALIVKRKGKNQYAVIFRGTIIGSGGIELSGMESNEEMDFVPYPKIPGELNPPSRDIRVYRGMQEGFEVFRDELEFFFNVLVASNLEQKLLVDLINTDSEERASRIAAIGGAIGVKYGSEVQKRVVNNIFATVQRVIDGQLDISDVSFNELVAKEIKFDRVLQEMVDSSEGAASESKPQKLEVYMAGHSRGAALATLSALYLKRYWGSRADFPDFSIKMYNVGSPKVGNKTFVSYYNRQMKGFSYRVQNLFDPAIYVPFQQAPFPYNLQLFLPGVDYVRQGDKYYANYEHVGEAYTIYGLGNQKLDLDFGGPFKLTLPVPFPHGPDGYKEMLIQAREQQSSFWKPAQMVASTILREQKTQISELQEEIAELRKVILEQRKQ